MFRNLLDKAADLASKVLPPTVNDLNWVRVTPRIIVAALLEPSQEKSASAYLHQNHADHFMIWNLSAYKAGGTGSDGKLVKALDYALFDDNVLEFSLPNHPAPLELLFELCKSMFSWLSSDPGNIAVIHSLSTGRAVMATACYLTYSGKFNSGQEVLDYMNTLHEGQRNVCVPSQIRYINYFTELLSRKQLPTDYPLRLVSMRLVLPEKFGAQRSDRLNPFIQIVKGKKLLFSSAWAADAGDSISIVEDVMTIVVDKPLFADCVIRCYHQDPTVRTGRTLFFKYSFHAGFFVPGPIRVTVADLDDAAKYDVGNSFFVELMFSQTTDDSLNPALTAAESEEADALAKYLADGAGGSAERIALLAESSPLHTRGVEDLSATTTTKAPVASNSQPTPQQLFEGFPEPPVASPPISADTRVVIPPGGPALSQEVPKPTVSATSSAVVSSDEGRRDPFSVLSDDLAKTVLSRLDHRSLARCLLVCRRWRELASADDLWSKYLYSPLFSMCRGVRQALSEQRPDHMAQFLKVMSTTQGNWTDNVSAQSIITLEPAHQGVIRGVVFNGDYIASASDDMLVMVWKWSAIHAGDLEAMHSLFGHSGEVSCIALVDPAVHSDASDTWIVSGAHDHSIRVWDPDTGDELQCLESHIGEIESVVVINGRRIASAAADYALKVWDIVDGLELFTIQESISGLYKPFMGLRFNGLTSTLDALVPDGESNVQLISYSTCTGQVLSTISGAIDVPDDEAIGGDFYGSRVLLTDSHAVVRSKQGVVVTSPACKGERGPTKTVSLGSHGASTLGHSVDSLGGSSQPWLVAGIAGAVRTFFPSPRSQRERLVALPTSHAFVTSLYCTDFMIALGVVQPETPNSTDPYAEPQLTDPCNVMVIDATRP